MKIKIFKGNNGIEANTITDSESEKVFNNLELIDSLYKNEEINLEFHKDISEEEQEKIKQLFDEMAALRTAILPK